MLIKKVLKVPLKRFYINSMSDISPYTRVIADCLESLEEDHHHENQINNKVVAHRLINMLQGRMLEHLKTRVSSHYGLKSDALSEEFHLSLY